jgi:osmotically-inducible protein OsmY
MTFSRQLIAVAGALLLGTSAMTVSADPASDAALTEAVKAELAKKDPGFLGPAQVEVHDGIVTFTGQVLMPRTLFKAMEVSRSVHGVKQVVNRTRRPA